MQQKAKSRLVGVFQCLIFLLLVSVIELPAIFMAASDHILHKGPHPLYTIFREGEYANLVQFMNTHKYTQIIATRNSNIKSFINSYGNSLQQNETVLLREYRYHPIQIVYPWFRFTRYLIEDYFEELKQDSKLKQTWVLIGIQEDIPEKDVIELMQRYPGNKVILITKKQMKIKCASCKESKFELQKFPQLRTEDLIAQIQLQYGLSENSSTFITNFYDDDNLDELFTVLNTSKLLSNSGEYYQNISKLNEKERQILHQLCNSRDREEDANWETTDLKKLEKYGVILIDHTFQWRHPNYIMNYAIQASSNCLISQLDREELQKYDKFQRILHEQQKEWQQTLQTLPLMEKNSEVVFDQVIKEEEIDKHSQNNVKQNLNKKLTTKHRSRKNRH